MVDFIIKGNEGLVNKISTDVLIKKLNEKVNLDLANFMVCNQDDVEVTYCKDANKYRFDFVDVTELALKYMDSESREKIVGNNKFLANIDLDLENNKFILFDAVDGIRPIIESDLEQTEKLDLLNKFKQFQKELKELGFILESIDDSSMMSLVFDNLVVLTTDILSKALCKIENHCLENHMLYF